MARNLARSLSLLASFLLGFGASGCSSRKKGEAIRIDGSSTVELISKAAAEAYSKKTGAQVTVAGSGTGAGFKKFCRGEVMISGASRPIKPSELEDCKKAGIDFIELPVAYDGLAVVAHSKNTWVDHLTVDELKAMWSPEAQGKLTNWQQIRPGFPDKQLRLFGAGTDSGTFDYFTAAIVGKERSSRDDYTKSENDNQLVQGITMDDASLGYFGFAYYAANKDKLKLVAIDDGKPENGAGPILPSETTIADGTYQPLARPIFIYVSKRAADSKELSEFVRFYLAGAADFARQVGYVALPPRAAELALARFDKKILGSVFGHGSQVGITVEQLLAAEGK